MQSSQIKSIFLVELFRLICVVWPMLSGVFFAMVGPGLLIGHIEEWRIDDALYSNSASYSCLGRTIRFVTQLKE
jgi:hypothetical protein